MLLVVRPGAPSNVPSPSFTRNKSPWKNSDEARPSGGFWCFLPWPLALSKRPSRRDYGARVALGLQKRVFWPFRSLFLSKVTNNFILVMSIFGRAITIVMSIICLSIHLCLFCFRTCFHKGFRLSASRRSLSSLSASQGLEFAQELVGDNERQLLSEFRRCYRENPYPEKLNLFFPNEERIISLLYASTSSYTSSSFLSTVDRIFRQLHAWPSAWPLCRKLLSPEHPWSEAYSKQIIAEGATAQKKGCYKRLEKVGPRGIAKVEEVRN